MTHSSDGACACLLNWKSADRRALRESYYLVEKDMCTILDIYYIKQGIIVSVGAYASLACQNWLLFVQNQKRQ